MMKKAICRFLALSFMCLASIGMLQILTDSKAFAAADAMRQCEGYYLITLQSQASYTIASKQFESHGVCGETVPNRCRHRAARELKQCMQQHWSQRFGDLLPVECTGRNHIMGYGFVSLEKELTALVCAKYPGDHHVVMIEGVIKGHAGCGGDDRSLQRLLLASDYRLECRRGASSPWMEGTDRPGYDYKTIDLQDQSHNPDLCRQECQRDTKCKAWVYMKPAPGRTLYHRCVLKSSVPQVRNDACCTSGVK